MEEPLRQKGFTAVYDLAERPSLGQGSMVIIAAAGGLGLAGFTSLGQRGKKAN